MQLGNCWANVVCNSYALEEFAPLQSADGRTMTCYINSQPGQKFSIHGGLGPGPGDEREAIDIVLYADRQVLERRVTPRDLIDRYSLSGIRVSPTEKIPFEFADYRGKPVEEWDEDDQKARTANPNWQHTGTISLELWRAKVSYTSEGLNERTSWNPETVGLRTVTLGSTVTSTNTLMDSTRPYVIVDEESDKRPFAIFRWQHRDRAFLERYQFTPRMDYPYGASPSSAIGLPGSTNIRSEPVGRDVAHLNDLLAGMAFDSSRGGGKYPMTGPWS